MRVALVGPVYPYRGGIAQYTTRLYQSLMAQGHDVLLVSFSRQYPQWLYPGNSDRDPSRTSLRVESAHEWIDSLNPLTWLAAAHRISRWRPELLVLPWWTTFWAPVWLTLLLWRRSMGAGPVAVICHNVLPHEARPWDRRLTRWVLGQVSLCVVHTAAERERLLELLPATSVSVVPHPIYDIFGLLTLDARVARHRLHLPLAGPLLLFFGIVRPYKGLDDLLEALPSVRAQVPGVHLVVAGDFWGNFEHYRRQVTGLGLDDAVSLHDHYVPNEEVPLYFAASEVLVAPYRRATGSGIMQVARGFGMPVIGTEVMIPTGESCDQWEGTFVPPCDPPALARAIISFFAGSVHRERRIPNQDVVQDSWQKLVDALTAAGSGAS